MAKKSKTYWIHTVFHYCIPSKTSEERTLSYLTMPLERLSRCRYWLLIIVVFLIEQYSIANLWIFFSRRRKKIISLKKLKDIVNNTPRWYHVAKNIKHPRCNSARVTNFSDKYRVLFKEYHYVKSVRIWNFSGLYFPIFRLNTEIYRAILQINSVRTRENMDQKSSEYRHFLRSKRLDRLAQEQLFQSFL